MQCQLCDTYYHAERTQEKVKIAKDKEMVITNRYCKHKDTIVNEGDDSCEKFLPCTFFWCKGWDSWVTAKACKNRIDKDHYRSCPCSLGIEAEALIELAKPRVEKKQLAIRVKKRQLVVRRK